MQDLEVRDPYLDEEVIIKGNNEEKIMLLLADYKLRELICELPRLSFEIKGDI